LIKFPLKQNQVYTAKILLKESQANTTNDQLVTFFTELGFVNCSSGGVNNERLVSGTWNKADSLANWPEDQYSIESWSHK
jgi:hypothetical protein